LRAAVVDVLKFIGEARQGLDFQKRFRKIDAWDQWVIGGQNRILGSF